MACWRVAQILGIRAGRNAARFFDMAPQDLWLGTGPPAHPPTGSGNDEACGLPGAFGHAVQLWSQGLAHCLSWLRHSGWNIARSFDLQVSLFFWAENIARSFELRL